MSGSTEIEQGYRVLVDDNFHYMDESYRECAGTFANYEEALDLAQKITVESVVENESSTAAETFQNYMEFGEDPFIQPFGGVQPPKEDYSAWTTAKLLAQIIENERSKQQSKGEIQ